MNSCQVALKSNAMAAGDTVTLRYKARWLHGWPEPLLRLNGNWLEATAAMPVPSNLGTPGQPNSRYVTNAGPALYNVTHTPTVPAANQPVGGHRQVHDPTVCRVSLSIIGLTQPPVILRSPMHDNGTGGDAIATTVFTAPRFPARRPIKWSPFTLPPPTTWGPPPGSRPCDQGITKFPANAWSCLATAIPAGSFGVTTCGSPKRM